MIIHWQNTVFIDSLTRTITRQGQSFELEPQILKLAEYFLEHPGEIITRAQLSEQVWQSDQKDIYTV